MLQEEDATVWARYSSAYFEQSAGRHACNNPYNQKHEEQVLKEMKDKGSAAISYKDFIDIINPSFAAVDSPEDMDAIMTRTHVILITENGIFWRVASTHKKDVSFIAWPQRETPDILVPDQLPIFKEYKANPGNHQLPPGFHEDSVWSQEVLRRLISGEQVPKIVTIHRHQGLFGQEVPPQHVPPQVLSRNVRQLRVKQEKAEHVWTNLKKQGRVLIDLDSSPSPPKRQRTLDQAMPSNPRENPELPGLSSGPHDDDVFMPAVGECPDEDLTLEQALEEEMEEELSRLGGHSDADAFKDVCGVLVLQWIGLPISCTGNGPFSVTDLNEMIRPFHIQFEVCHNKLPGRDGMYLCHQGSHFTGLKTCEGFFQHFDNGITSAWTMGKVANFMEQSDVTLFCLRKGNQTSMPSLSAYIGGSSESISTFTCPLERCACPGCSGTLLTKDEVDSVIYGLAGPQECILVTKQCSSRSCRTVYGFNYRWKDGAKINCVQMDDLTEGILFISSKVGFTTEYLKYHEELLFRGQVATRATSYAYNQVFVEDMAHAEEWFRRIHETGLFYFMSLHELQKIGLHKDIEIDQEVSDHALDVYHAYCHSSLFPPKQKRSVQALVGDGHGQIKVKCQVGPLKRVGRPRKNAATVGKRGNGWFAICDPKSQRILALNVMHEPEGNEVAINSFKDILWLYPQVDTIIYDRACHVHAAAQQDPLLEQVKYFIVDRFHALRHGKKCQCNPRALETILSALSVHSQIAKLNVNMFFCQL